MCVGCQFVVIRPRAAWRCRVTSSRPRRCWLRSLRRGRDPTPAQALLCHVLDQRGRADSGHTAAVGSQEHRNCSPVNPYPLCCATVLLSATLARTVFSAVRGQRSQPGALWIGAARGLSRQRRRPVGGIRTGSTVWVLGTEPDAAGIVGPLGSHCRFGPPGRPKSTVREEVLSTAEVLYAA